MVDFWGAFLEHGDVDVHWDVDVLLAPHNISTTSEPEGLHFPSNVSQVHADPKELEVSENNPLVQPMAMFPSRAANPNSSLQETTFDESNVQTFQNTQTDNTRIEQRIASDDSENPVQHKRKKTEKIEISRETLEELQSQGMTTEEAAKELGVSRPTVVRRYLAYNMKWPRPKKRKQHEDENTVDPANVAGRDHRVSNDLSSLGNVVLTSNLNAIRRTVEEPSLESQCQVDGQQAEEHSNGANECTSSNTDVQLDGSPRTFVVMVKKDSDALRFDISLTAIDIQQFKDHVAERLELKAGEFKMTYQDEDNELMLMTSLSDLYHAVIVSKLSGSSVIRLSIV